MNLKIKKYKYIYGNRQRNNKSIMEFNSNL